MTNSSEERHRLVERVLLAVHLIGKGLHRNLRSRESLPVSRPQLGLLWMTSRRPGLTVSDLARRFMLAKSNVSEMVERLGRQDLLEKKPDETDQRLVRLYVTEKGRLMLQTAWARHLESAGEALAGLSEGQLAEAARHLETIARSLNQNNPGGGDD